MSLVFSASIANVLSTGAERLLFSNCQMLSVCIRVTLKRGTWVTVQLMAHCAPPGRSLLLKSLPGFLVFTCCAREHSYVCAAP